MPRRSLRTLYRDEFRHYSLGRFSKDLLAGFTVAAVALPLALAFGVASGSTASAGLVTAILAGLIIGGLSGAPYQISGPTGAMSAILILISAKYGVQGVWVAGLMSGLLLTAIGVLRLGRFIAFIPSPVITGFTSGIALIIVVGQFDNLVGMRTPGTDSAAGKVIGYFTSGIKIEPYALMTGLMVMAIMLFTPKRINSKVPGSLLGIIAATIITHQLNWPVAVIGEIPGTLILDQRLVLQSIDWHLLQHLVVPALSITALGAIESLLCGAVASNMTGIRLQANQELIAQGIGNIVIPFFGGVPATAAIARTSVGIKSGGRTRIVSITHALVILASIFIFAPIMSKVPLAALAGVLIITAWRMNEWEEIHYIFKYRLKTAMLTFSITMLATFSLDLTQAILIGTFLSGAVFLSEISQLDVDIKEVDHAALLAQGIIAPRQCPHIKVAFLTGPIFFAATGHFNEALSKLENLHCLILSMRGVPLLDTSGLLALEALCEKLKKDGATVMLTGVHKNVQSILDQGGLTDVIGKQNILWSSDQAIVAAGELGCKHCSALGA